MSEPTQYPEHDKLRPIHDISQQQGMFVDWLNEEHSIVLAQYGEDDELYPITRRIEDLLAEYHDIDLRKLDDEKRAMLEEIRKAQLAQQP